MFVGSGIANIPVLENAAIRLLDKGVHLGSMNLEVDAQHPANPVRAYRRKVVFPLFVRLVRGQGWSVAALHGKSGTQEWRGRRDQLRQRFRNQWPRTPA